jgi:ClpP class serine protease
MNSTIVAMEPRLWMAFLEDVRMAQDNKVVFAAKSTPAKSTPTADVVNISGVLMRSVPAEYKAFGLDMTGYDDIAEAITKAAQSKSERIILNVSSGGGMTDAARWGGLKAGTRIAKCAPFMRVDAPVG